MVFIFSSQLKIILTFSCIIHFVISINQTSKCPDICICLDIYADCSQHNLEEIPFSLPEWTERLDLSNNQLRIVPSAPLKQLLSLTRLELHKNLLTSLPVLNGLNQLRFLSVASNLITAVSREALEAVPQLQILDLTGNRIAYLPPNIFPERNALSILILNNNHISDMHVQCFENLTHLTELKLNRNKITHLPKNLFRNQTRLKLLEINKNQLETIDGLTFTPLEHLTVLKLKRNKITYLMDGAFYGLKDIGVIELDGNSLTKVSKRWLYGLTTLTTLSLAGNLIYVIEPDAWSSCSHLKELDLSNNRLQDIGRDSLKQLTHLTRLNLNSNQIAVITDGAFNNTPRLQYLDISNNKISSTIEDDMVGVFIGLKKLLRLSLTSNKIKSINRRAFLGLENVTSLDLSGNNIIGIQENAFSSMPMLQDLVMNTSSLLCDCNLQWFSNWLRESKFLSIEARCAYPLHLRSKQLIHLSQANFTCGDSPKPYLIEGPETKMTLKGENVSLRCRAKSSSPIPMIFKWKRDNVDIVGQSATTAQVKSDNGRQNEATSELHLYNVTHSDIGKYQCIVENGFGTTYSSKAYISVLIYPSFTKFPKNISVLAGQTAKLECRAHGQPTPNIAWQKDGGHDFPAARERRMHVMPTDDEFFIINAKHNDTGVYSCIANNSAGVIIANATLTVLEPPSFSKPMENKDVMVGGTIVLHCMAAGMPRPTVTWSKDNEPLASTERHFLTAGNELLVIVDTHMSDAGKYQCKLSNVLGSVSGYTDLIVIPAPVAVMREGDMMGVIVITVVFCAVGTSIVWVVIIYQTRKRISLSALHHSVQHQPVSQQIEPAHPSLDSSIVPVVNSSEICADGTITVTCVYTDNVSEHSSCKDSGMGDSAKRSSDDFLPASDDYSNSSPHYVNNSNNQLPQSEQPLLPQNSSASSPSCYHTEVTTSIRPTNHERLSTSSSDNNSHLVTGQLDRVC